MNMGITFKQLLTVTCMTVVMSAAARDTYNFNSGWRIDKQKKTVTLPHAWNEDEAFKVGIHDMSDSVIWYRKTFVLPKNAEGRRVFIEFEGARQAAEVFVNGKNVGLHENGVMAFGFDLTPYVKRGKNLIEVRTDNDWRYHERATGSTIQWNNNNFNSNYGGLPKNVKLHITDNVYQTLPLYSNLKTTGIYVYAKDHDIQGRQATVCVESEVRNETDAPVTKRLQVTLTEMDGREICGFGSESVTIPARGTVVLKARSRAYGLHFWSWGYGYLYKVKTALADDKASSTDEVTTVTGFRKTEFKNGMFYLNDRVMMVHGYAQRTSNEWPGVGMSVPAWLSDYSNDLMVKSGGNVVRWMHVAPWKQDVESCDRVGLIQAMPAGDAEKDVDGRRWEQREEVMRDAIIYNRNNPSIIFYECGNQKISAEHMISMKAIRDEYDPDGGRAIGCREMLDRPEAEYGGEMLYVNKSDTKPMWMMEYCRDEALRWYWNSWSYPYHKEGDGPLYRNAPADAYNHNQDEFVRELVARWYDYWLERPGSGTKVNSGGVKIVFSDTQTHGRSADNYRVSGVVDPMRVPKDAFYAHQVMWDGWVDDLKPRTHIVGHWNYKQDEVIPTIYVVSTSDSVTLSQGGKTITADEHLYRFLHVFKNVKYTSGKLTATAMDRNGRVESTCSLETAGDPASIKLTAIENPTGWKADGNDLAIVQVEIVDKQGRRCPLDNRLVKFSLSGPAEWRGGVAKGKDNHVLCDTLPVECGVNRVMLRSLDKAGNVTLTAKAEGMGDAKISFTTKTVAVEGGLTTYMPSDGLKSVLDRGETPASPSFRQWRRSVAIESAVTGSGNDPRLSFDTFENTSWESGNKLDEAWITYTLAENTTIDDICVKMKGFRATTYPIAVYAGEVKVWEGWTPKSLSYIHIPLKDAPKSRVYTIRSLGSSTTKDAFGAVQELDSKNNEKKQRGNNALKIIEIEFLKNL
ncbi:MAG: beta-galactosidase [Prevotella sp.]|nr:beta-galactosidase [Prevotella sp.]